MLIIADGKKFFTRSVSIGGANITSAIAKEYNVSFVEAENSKLSSGLVTLGGSHADQLDDATAALGTVVRNALTRLTAEIQHSVSVQHHQPLPLVQVSSQSEASNGFSGQSEAFIGFSGQSEAL